MKKLLVGLVVVLMGMFLAMPAVYAYPVSEGQTIQLSFEMGNNYGGGALNVSLNGEVLFDTFCVERTEHIALNTSYVITSITNNAIHGGANVAPSVGVDPLDTKTAFLYSQWASLAIGHTAENANALQLAIWFIEGELANGPGGNVSSDLTSTYTANIIATGFVQSAANASGLYGVQVMNLGADSGNQDLLVTGVPEPSTLLFLGSGLLGLGFAIRRRKS